MKETETLFCVPGNHIFTRTRTKGRKPTICTPCKDVRNAAKEAIPTPQNRSQTRQSGPQTGQNRPQTDENESSVGQPTSEVETYVKVSSSELAERLFIKMAALANKERQVIVH